MKFAKAATIVALSGAVFASCTGLNRSMRTPNHHVEFDKDDFEFSAPLSGEATQTRILLIDWKRLFKRERGENREAAGALSIGSIAAQLPVVGGVVGNNGLLEGYAMYDLVEKNQGYDVVFFPQYEIKTKSFLFFYSKSTVKVTARLGKLK